MICHHDARDPECSSNGGGYKSDYRYEPPVTTPDSSKFEIQDVEEVGKILVMKVRYPNCGNCSYEGNKILVFENVALKQVLKWRKIDPHFRATTTLNNEAPSPIARFPGSKEGWKDALAYALTK